MRWIRTACGVASLVIFTIDCGGAFCDEYPEACGSAGGALAGGEGPVAGAPRGGHGGGEDGGGGAGPVAPIEVAVSVVDGEGDPGPQIPLLVTDPDGALLLETDTGVDGVRAVEVPEHGRVWAFLAYGGVSYVYSAEVVTGVSTLRFLLRPDPPVVNDPEDTEINFYCDSAACGVTREASLSCRQPITITDIGPYYSQTVSGYRGCDGSPNVDAFLLAYDAAGKAVGQGSDQSILTSGAVVFPEIFPVAAGERFDLDMTVTGLFNFDVERWVRVPNENGRGYGFSRNSEATSGTVTFSLVKELVPTFLAGFSVQFSTLRFLLRQQLMSGVASDTDVAIDVQELALPESASAVDFSIPEQPMASFALGEGPLGDAVILSVNDSGERIWTIMMPAAESGSVRLPVLPTDLAAYGLVAGDASVRHVEFDDVAGYVDWTSASVDDPLFSETLDDLTMTIAL